MDEHETRATYNIAETCCASISIDDLRCLSEDKAASILSFAATKLTYGAIRGRHELRANLARLYSGKTYNAPLPAENILITRGAIEANFLTLYALVGPGDHVVCHYPTYQQLYSVPASLGAEVSLWKSRVEDEWQPSVSELRSLVKPNTKLIILNNPQNPTGAVLRRSTLQSIIDIARENKEITILSDEVYRPIFHGISPADPEFPPSILSMGYEHAVATGSLSKAYGLAGLRVGWIASRSREAIERVALARDYTTISVSQLDSAVAAYALAPETVHRLLGRNVGLARTNLDLLDKFVAKFDDECDYVRPVAGTTAFVRFRREGAPVDAVELCERLFAATGVLIVPGSSCFGDDFAGFVRVGYACETDVLTLALEKWKAWMKRHFHDVPLAAATATATVTTSASE